MTDRPSGAAPSRLVAVLGPTNTGKTHLAVERMLGHASGMIGLPLRLLAREVYDRIVKLRGPRAVALITGEEKIVPPHPHYYVCTVEAMPLNREVEFLAVDEIQLCADPERGHVFTQRLLHARGKFETMFLGSGSMAPLVRRLLPEAEIQTRERFSSLTYDGSKKLTRLPRRTAVVAFSTDAVYAIAELIRRQRGGAAVVMGSLSPRTRNAQVALYQSGEVDFLVATDAIGMGLNMDVDHVAFSGLRKFDGRRTRWLYPQEVGQIAGRAGRYRTNGTFGVTGEAEEMDEALINAVETHRFEPVAAAEWRNSRLDFASLSALMRSLSQPPSREGLKLAEESLDEKALRLLAQDSDIQAQCRNREHLLRLWDACQTPDFRKLSSDEHLRLVRTLFDHLTRGDRRLPEDWIDGQFAGLDRTDGDIDALAARLAGVRTLAYCANRPDWLRDPAHWQGRMRGLEERLSDTLHERLMQRFIDRRTSALLRGLQQRQEILAGVNDQGDVTVEGHFVGRLRGLRFEPARGASALEDKALRAAAERVVAPELARRMGRLAQEPDDAFALLPDGMVTWRGDAAGRLAGGGPMKPRVRLLAELGAAPARERAVQRLEAFVAAEGARRLKSLHRLEAATRGGALHGLARGIGWRLIEAGGIIDRASAAADITALSQAERRSLQIAGVRFGAFSLYLPGLLRPPALAFSAAFATADDRDWAAAPDRISPLPQPAPSPRALARRGLRAVGALAVPVEALERLDQLLRAAPRRHGGQALTPEALAALGWSEAEARAVMRGLGFTPLAKTAPGEASVWRRRRKAVPDAPASAPPEGSPFAALAALKPAPAAHAKPRRRRAPRPGRVKTGS
ncbi:MAG TPA: helicase-related protein [Caulobacteraceae bacterium]|nr:helicase-related protein [Caulobacteraceae bacterium]